MTVSKKVYDKLEKGIFILIADNDNSLKHKLLRKTDYKEILKINCRQ